MLVQEHFLSHFPYLERVQGALEEVPRGPTGPLGPLELAALIVDGERYGERVVVDAAAVQNLVATKGTCVRTRADGSTF